MPVTGSDCPSGKEQFTRDGAAEKVKAMRAQGVNVRKHHCPWGCGMWHVGHRRRADKKSERTRRH